MITQGQIKDLAAYYQIDEFTIFREYLQLLFLNYLYRHKKSTKIYFKGGTAIHLLFNSSRFSEDLDFSCSYNKHQIKQIIKEVEKDLRKELAEIKIYTLYQGKKSIRFRLKYKPSYFKYPFVIRLDFAEEEKLKKAVSSPLITKFPVFFPIIPHLSAEEVLAEKIRALLTRGKGRDVFDLWFLLEKGVKIDNSLVVKKLKAVSKQFSQEKLLKKIKDFPLKRLGLDLSQFLPQQQRKIIKTLKKRLIDSLLLSFQSKN
ncbi:nucleotidyl transferase AbiEii/AbiGii toxin family protein [Candidatus Microgenomates bacterium]|nr:nucleotidyl transferase AbiEii/AbiGii toxin family protein [Candidatus Microgenomates bacterium]